MRTMAWPPMARPIASMAWPFDGGEVEQEAFAGLAQRIDRMVHLQRRFRRQPGSKGEDALRRVLLQHQRGVAGDLRPVAAGRPRRSGSAVPRTAAPGSGRPAACRSRMSARSSRLARARRGRALRINRIGGHHGKAEQRERGGQHRDFLAVEVEQCRDRLRRARRRRQRRAGRRKRRPPARSRPSRSTVMCMTAASDASPRLRLT